MFKKSRYTYFYAVLPKNSYREVTNVKQGKYILLMYRSM